MRDYMVVVNISRKDKSGWTRTVSLPTFFLSGAIQGITNIDHAKRVALAMIRDVLYVSGYDDALNADISIDAHPV
jgi:hypothetical protein